MNGTERRSEQVPYNRLDKNATKPREKSGESIESSSPFLGLRRNGQLTSSVQRVTGRQIAAVTAVPVNRSSDTLGKRFSRIWSSLS